MWIGLIMFTMVVMIIGPWSSFLWSVNIVPVVILFMVVMIIVSPVVILFITVDGHRFVRSYNCHLHCGVCISTIRGHPFSMVVMIIVPVVILFMVVMIIVPVVILFMVVMIIVTSWSS